MKKTQNGSGAGRKEKPARKQIKSARAEDRTPDVKSTAENGTGMLTDPLERQPFFVVGLGASAGGLETLEQFFSHMPPDSGMAFVVVVHLDPTHKTLLPELLARYTRMEVCTAEEGMTVEQNVVYVIPANRDMTLSGGQLHLEEPQAPRGMRHTIDVFLRSLAADMEENAIAVILSGTGTDGTQGVKAVKEGGGIVVVQEEATAKYPGMPQSAIATGVADLILPTPKIPEKILEIAHRSTLLAQRKEAEPARMIADQLKAIYRIVNSRTGHDFSAYKTSTIMRRIERRMAVNGINDINDYIRFLKDNTDESRALFKEFLIGVTSFFRDPEAFEALEQQVINRLLEGRDPDEPLRVWLTGCATGEEAYSVGMLLREYSREHRLDLKVQIFATDIDGDAIDFARAGLYPDSIGADVSPERLRAFFKKSDSTYQVVKPLREMIVFAQHNLIKDPPFTRLDLLVCRNLLIYLNPDLQRRILPLFAQSLKPNGFLFLGTSETVGGFTDLFLPLEKKWKIFQRRESVRRLGIEFPIAPVRPPIAEGEPVRAYQEAGISPGVLAEKTLMQRYSPPCVVINEKFEVVYFSTRTSRYLEPPVGEPSQNLLKMAREDLRPALRAAVHKALTEQQTAVYRGLKITTESGEETLDLRVEPVTRPASAKGLALVIFEPTGTVQLVEQRRTEYREPAEQDESSRELMVKPLEEQLRITNEQLQSSIERMETSNEELKSSNEELMSMNEEFQSTNEELETSKEELQALNEELVTVNAELQNKVEELGQTNDDLQNFLASTDIATIFLDRQFRVKRFSPAMAKLSNLIMADIGRPLQHFTGMINFPELLVDVEKVLDKLAPVERELFDPERQFHYLVRVLPYRTMEDVIDGVVVTFIDITDRKRMEEQTFHLASFPRLNPNPVMEIDLDGTIVYFNPAVREILRSLGLDDHDATPFLPADLASLLTGWDHETETSHLREVVIGERTFAATVHLVPTIKVARIYAYDITERKQAEAKLRESEELYRAIGESINYGVWVCDSDGRNIYASPSFLDLVGMTQEQCSNFGWGDILHPDEAADTISAWKECTRTGEVWYREHRYRGVDGKWHPILARGVPVRDMNGTIKYWAGINLDISKLKQAEEEILTAKQAAEEANCAKSNFVANMSHEIRTPLTGILGMLELLGQAGLNPEQEKYREMAEGSGRTLLRVINDILDFSRMEAGKMEVARVQFNLRTCIQGGVDIFSFAAEKKGLALKLSFPANIPVEVMGDCDRLRQLMFNLIGNAIKFTEQGKISVSVRLVDDGKAHSHTRAFSLEVTDTGIGIPADKLEHIFESFTQIQSGLNRGYGGSGLGLAISRKLAELMGGTISVRSEDGVGSTFMVELPLELAVPQEDANPNHEDCPAAQTPIAEGQPGNAAFCILLAEDDPTIVHIMQEVITRKGYELAVARNGKEAFEIWEQGGVDLILMDVQMPLMDGLTATSRIRQQEEDAQSRTPIVCLTAHAFDEDKQRCLAAGADSYLSKPLDFAELFRVVEEFRNPR